MHERRIISDEDLDPRRVPGPDASWDQIEAFALTYDGYTTQGSFEKCAEIANARRNDSLGDLRTCLFFEQRRWRHFGEMPDDESMAYIRGLVDGIRSRLTRPTQT